MLVAIFRARPSPFYVMDEVEAALDDTNMRRLIGLLQELRATSQLIIITHQKPTMEIADALYGVSMRGDGITQVISQRLGANAKNQPNRSKPKAVALPAPETVAPQTDGMAPAVPQTDVVQAESLADSPTPTPDPVDQ
jgi:chromosome segregation protein